MALVILIEGFHEETWAYIETDMRRWWGNRCKKIVQNGEVLFDVGAPKKFRLYEGVKRFASFGVKARVVRRDVA